MYRSVRHLGDRSRRWFWGAFAKNETTTPRVMFPYLVSLMAMPSFHASRTAQHA
jgi:hypothetical protein